MQLLLDTVMRLAELHGLNVDDIDFDHGIAAMLGKGRRPCACPSGTETARALDRHLRSRASHRDGDRPELWLGRAGPLTRNGVYKAVRERTHAAELAHINHHRFRYTFPHQWLSAGGDEMDLMRLAGWRSRSMVGRYGASAADERARDDFQGMAPGIHPITGAAGCG